MRNKTKEIIANLAKHHGITLMQAEEIWRLMGSKIAEVISSEDKKNSEGLYDIENFPVIHIDNFGKFFPSKRVIHHSNTNLKKKIDNHEHNI